MDQNHQCHRAEGKIGKATHLIFTVTLSAAYDQAVSMSHRTVDGAAKTGDNDYIAKTGTLTFAPGETTKTITIEVKGDRNREANEYFYLDLFDLSSNRALTILLPISLRMRLVPLPRRFDDRAQVGVTRLPA